MQCVHVTVRLNRNYELCNNVARPVSAALSRERTGAASRVSCNVTRVRRIFLMMITYTCTQLSTVCARERSPQPRGRVWVVVLWYRIARTAVGCTLRGL